MPQSLNRRTLLVYSYLGLFFLRGHIRSEFLRMYNIGNCTNTCTDPWLDVFVNRFVRQALLFALSMVILSIPSHLLVSELQDDMLECKLWLEGKTKARFAWGG